MNQYDLICSAQEDDYQAIDELIKREQKNIYASFCFLGGTMHLVNTFIRLHFLKQ